jgi:hypothetical protein
MRDRIQDGLKALDSVKHCGYKMTPRMVAHDKKMRNTPPNQWTEQDICDMEATARHVNGDSWQSIWNE